MFLIALYNVKKVKTLDRQWTLRGKRTALLSFCCSAPLKTIVLILKTKALPTLLWGKWGIYFTLKSVSLPTNEID